MIRKPQPKDAARAIIKLFAEKGVTVPMALALETVATVEGYNDWNAMAQLVPGAKEKTTKRTAKIYVGSGKRYRVVELRLSGDPTEDIKDAINLVVRKYDDEWLFEDRIAALQVVKQRVHKAVKVGKACVVLGLQEYDCDESGDAVGTVPDIDYVAHTWMSKVTVGAYAPQDVRETLAVFLKS